VRAGQGWSSHKLSPVLVDSGSHGHGSGVPSEGEPPGISGCGSRPGKAVATGMEGVQNAKALREASASSLYSCLSALARGRRWCLFQEQTRRAMSGKSGIV
jgi:hypothetical protein